MQTEATRPNPSSPAAVLLASTTPQRRRQHRITGSGEKILRQGLEFAQKLLPLLMESHPSGDPFRRGKRTAQNRTPNPSFTFFREYRTHEMKRQTRFCRLFTVCLFVASVNVVTNRKLTSYNAFLHRKVRRRPSRGTSRGCNYPHKHMITNLFTQRKRRNNRSDASVNQRPKIYSSTVA